MTAPFIRIIQITDTHLFPKNEQRLLNINTWDSFQAVLARVKADCELIPPHLIVLTGDLAQEAALETYQRLHKEFKSFACPIAWIPGNHDELPLMQQGLKGKPFIADKAIQLNGWEMILLNSKWTQHVEGKISDEELGVLENRLKTSESKYHLLMIHHPLLDMHTTWLDKLKLSNHERLFKIIDQFPTIKIVLSGHVHQLNEQIRQGVSYLTTPSTCIQFKPHSQTFSPDSLYPGYRWINLLPNGSFRSDIVRVKPPEWTPDLKSGGY